VATTQSDLNARQTKAVPKPAKTSPLWSRFWDALTDVRKPAFPDPYDQTVIGKAIGVGQTMVSAIKTGDKLPGVETALAMAQYAQMSVIYLLQGEGPQRPWSDMDTEFRSLIQFWEALDDANRGELLKRADELFRLQETSRRPRFAPQPTSSRKATKKPAH
jgi:transcriptional regulator with XRE-family HTH domain